MIYGMAWQACHGIWYGLIDMTLFMVWPGGHGMWYGLGGQGMVYGIS